MRLDIDRLIRACSDDSCDAGVSIHGALEPLAGPGAPVKPPIYAGARQTDLPRYQEDSRWWGDPPERTRVIVVDNVPSQANRLEAALEHLCPELGLPEVRLDLSSLPNLPSHLPRQISGFHFPHRHADAYLRDAIVDGKPATSAPGLTELVNATAENPLPLFEWFPQALLFGYWQSHLGKKRTQAKLARSWVSEIAGFAPAGPPEWTRVLGLKGDPLNLSVDERAVYNADDVLAGWEMSSEAKAGRGKGERLSELGHGQVPFGDAALATVSFKSIEQHATASFAGLRRIHCQDPTTSAAGRALLVALGLVAHVAAFGRGFSLRSGCDLRPSRTTWLWLGSAADEPLDATTLDDAKALFLAARERAAAVGLTTGGGWGREPLVVTPSPQLSQAIASTWAVGA